MGTNVRVIAGIAFSVAMSLAGMAVMSSFPGLAIPLPYWIFGGIAPLVISTPVCLMLARQANRNQSLNRELQAAFDDLRHLAEIDQMTGLLNRATFLRQMDAARSPGPGTCLLIDVDHFKAINDGHGHAAGDMVLATIAACLRTHLRQGDRCGRMGGEEFAVYLPGVTGNRAMAMAERLRRAVAEIAIATQEGRAIRPTISVGVAQARDDAPMEDVLRRADMAMYHAKRGGRNQVRQAA